jgi:hypothetical protein
VYSVNKPRLVIRDMWPVTCDPRPVTRDPWPVTRDPWPVTCEIDPPGFQDSEVGMSATCWIRRKSYQNRLWQLFAKCSFSLKWLPLWEAMKLKSQQKHNLAILLGPLLTYLSWNCGWKSLFHPFLAMLNTWILGYLFHLSIQITFLHN